MEEFMMKKSKINPLEEYFLMKFKEMGIEIIPPKKEFFKNQSARASTSN